MTDRTRSVLKCLRALTILFVCALGVVYELIHPSARLAVMSANNAFLTISMVAYEQMRVLFNELVLLRHVNRQYNHLFAAEGAKAGASVNARKPPQYTIRTGQAVSIQNMVETPAPITIQPQFGVDLDAATMDFSLSIDDFSHRFLRPAAIRMASFLDFTTYSTLMPQVWNEVGTPGNGGPTTIDPYLNAEQLMDESDAPDGDDRVTIMSPLMERKIVNGVTSLLNPQKQLGEQYIKGRSGRLANFEAYMSQSVPNQTTGVMAAGASAVKVNGLSQTGASIITNGWTAGDILNAGDVVQFANTHAVNPQNKSAYASLLNCVCTQTQTADSGGNMTIPIATSGNTGIVVSGQFQNADNAPTTNDVVSVYGSLTPSTVSGKVSPQGLAVHPDWAAFVMVDLPVYDKGVVEGFRVPAPELGLSLRVLKGYLINTDQLVTRVDGLYGFGLLYGELACRICA